MALATRRKGGTVNRFKALAIALVAVLAVAGVATAAPKKAKKVPATVTLAFKAGSSGNPEDPYANSRFAGKVKPKGPSKAKRVCRANRKVVLRAGRKRVGQAKTQANGRFAIPARKIVPADPYAPPRRYKAVVSAKKKGKFVCKRASSRAVIAP